MTNKLLLPSTILISLLYLTGCGETKSNSASVSPAETPTAKVTTAPETPTAKVTTAPVSQASPTDSLDKQVGKKLAPGTYCYSAKTKTLDAKAKINISSGNKVDGTVEATIHNDAASYYSSYNQTLKGDLVGDKAKLKIVTKIENDTQNNQETWTITESTLNTNRESFAKVDCATLTPDEETTPSARKPVRVKFAQGASSTTLKNSVVRGDRDTYLLGAKQGQQMSLKITSLENNAVFDVIAPDGETIKQEATSWSGELPANGDYQIIVGGTRGNASYELNAEIN